MFDEEKIKEIESFVYNRPRCISEIAQLLKVSWRTADRYLDKLSERGQIGIHTFRAGSQGGLKVAYWINKQAKHASKAHELIYARIINSTAKSDFSPFDVYQHTDPGKRSAFSELIDPANKLCIHGTQDINKLLRRTQSEYLSFSGDFSWTEVNENGSQVLDTLMQLAKRNVSIKMLGRINFNSIDNVERVLELNKMIEKEGGNAIEIRHIQQPLRGAIVDDSLLRLVEFSSATKGNKGEEQIFYEITDTEWIQKFKKIFWSLYNSAVPAEKRISDIKSLQFVRKE